MGLYDREWFWEGYEERYGIKNQKTSEPELKPQQNITQDQSSSKTITHYCKHCYKLINLTLPKADLNPLLQYSFLCPYCGKRNSLGNDKPWVGLLVGIIVAILILFLITILCKY